MPGFPRNGSNRASLHPHSSDWLAPSWWKVWLAFGVLLAIYANHFDNAFHFDDSHTVVENPAIRSLANIPGFFSDARTFSVNPSNQSWRPLVSTSLAVDYALGGGLNPLVFHLTTFLWFALLLFCVYRLYRRVLDHSLAFLATCLFGVHPTAAETVNYVIQRADLFVALGCVAGVLLFPRWLYLIPFVLAVLCKPTALVFPFLLLAFIAFTLPVPRPWLRTLPSLVLAGVLAALHRRMLPDSFNPGGADPLAYLLTQPYCWLHYALNLIWPASLVADTDWTVVTGPTDPRALVGLVFLVCLLGMIALTWKKDRVVAFGLTWFILALLPTSVMPLAEVTNDHRMFLAYIGLVLAFVRGLQRVAPWALSPLPVLVSLLALCLVTVQRNEVWHTESSLWADVVRKSPKSGRGWMNFGLTQMRAGQLNEALQSFERARELTPHYPVLMINLGVVHGALRHPSQAREFFARALELSPSSAEAYYFQGRWQFQEKRYHLAIASLQKATRLRSGYEAAEQLLRSVLETSEREVAHWQEEAARGSTTAQIELSLALWRAGRFPEAEQAARAAIEREPVNPFAWNNLAAACLEQSRWDEAAFAAQEALKLKPDFEIARNNLSWAREQMSRKP